MRPVAASAAPAAITSYVISLLGPRHAECRSEPLHLTIFFDQDDDGWIVASVPEVPGAHSQGRTQDEARENVLDALAGLLDLRA